MSKVSKKKRIPTATEKKALELRQAFKSGRKGYQQLLHETMASAMEIALELHEHGCNSFLSPAKQDFSEGEDAKNLSWVVRRVMYFVTAASSEPAQKLASKRARVVEFLYVNRKIPIEEIPAKIKEMGGIETIVKVAAEEAPRRSKKSASTVAQEPVGADDEDDGDDENKAPLTRAKPAITISISPERRKRLLGLKSGRRVKLIGVREGKTAVKVEKVSALKPHAVVRATGRRIWAHDNWD